MRVIILNNKETEYIRERVGSMGLMFQNLSYRTHGLILDLMNDKFKSSTLTSSDRGIEKNLVKLLEEMKEKKIITVGLFDEFQYLYKLTRKHYLGGG